MPKSKPTPGQIDAAVERLVDRWIKLLQRSAYFVDRSDIRAIITEARQSAARECAEIADNAAKRIARDGTLTGAPAVEYVSGQIQKHFGLDGK